MDVSEGEGAAESGDESSGQPSRFGLWVRWGLQGAVAAGLFGLVVWRAEPWSVGGHYDDFAVWPAAGAVALNVPLLGLLAMRGRFTLMRLGYEVPLLALLPISTLGNVAGSMTPAAAGDLVRTPFLKDRHGIPYAHGVAVVLHERGFSLAVLALSTGVAAGWSTLATGWALAVTLGGLALVMAGPAAMAHLLRRLRPAIERADDGSGTLVRRAIGALAGPLEALLRLLADVGTTGVVTLMNLVIFSVMALQMWLVMQALGLSLSAAEAWMVLGVAMLAGIITLLPLGLGTLDATLAAVVGAIEQDFSAGVAAAVLLRATVYLPLGLAAVGSYIYLVGGGGGRRAKAEAEVRS